MAKAMVQNPASTRPDSPIASRHPDYNRQMNDWVKWRLCYQGGRDFIRKYLVKFSKRETDPELADRKTIAYAPNFGRSAVEDIKNAIFQRTADVARVGGPKSWQEAIKGNMNGVDLEHASMGEFIGTKVLAEMLVMKRVGVLVDNEKDLGITQAEKGDKHPYLDVFFAEDILNWAPRNPVNGFDSLMLREHVDDFDEFGLPQGVTERFRLYRRLPEGGVQVLFYRSDGELIKEPMMLDLERIPFVLFEVGESLLKDVADYQIALLNLESSDIAFARKANFPFFYEFFDPKTEHPYSKGPSTPGDTGTTAEANAEAPKETRVGLSQGRRYPKDGKAPGFVNPDPATLEVSMKKGDQLKADIRRILNLNLQNMDPRRQGPDSKAMDNRGLEASLSFIGLVLQKGEREIGHHWRAFEGGEGDPIEISYPKSYSLQTDEDRQAEAERLEKLQAKLPSETARKAIAKKIARTLVGPDMTETELDKVFREIDEAETLTADPSVIMPAHKSGLVGDVTASNALGFNGKEEVPKAQADRAKRIELTLKAQGGTENAGAARGAPEFDKGQKDGSQEKEGETKRGQADKTT